MRYLLVLVIFIPFASSAQQRMDVRDSILYDFSGVTLKGSAGPIKAFTTNHTDDWRPTRIVADFNGDSIRKIGNGKGVKAFINLQEEFTFDEDTAIKFYDESGSRDTLWVFAWDKDNAPTWDEITNTENYTPQWTIITCGSCSGLPVTTILTSPAGRKVQYLLVVFRVTNLFSGLYPDVSKIEFRGIKTGNKDTTYNLAHWAFNAWTARPIDSIIGHFNLQNQQDTLWHDTATKRDVAYYGDFRTFDQMFFDDEVDKHNYRFNLGGAGYTAYKYNAAMARRGNFQFSVVFNDNAYYRFQLDSIGHTVSKSYGTNTIFDDPQQPASYYRKGRYMGFLAAHGGGDPTPKFYPTYNGTMTYGGGYLKGMGSNNEPTLFAFPNAWKNPLMVAAECHGIYDSIKRGDPNMPVFVGGYEGFNYPDAKATLMAMKLLARGRNIKADGLAYHGIHSLKTDSFPYIPTSSQQVGNHGVSPGYWSDWQKHIHYIQGCRREIGDPDFMVQCDEDGWQKGVYIRKPTTEAETFSVSQLGTPRFVVESVLLDAFASHGVVELQEMMICTATPMYKQFKYTLVDDIVSTNNPGYDAIDGNNADYDRPATCCTERPEAWPASMARTTFVKSFGRYVFKDSIIKITRGLHVFRYIHETNPESNLFLYSILDSVGTATVDLSSIIGVLAGTVVKPSLATRNSTTSAGVSNNLAADPYVRGFIVNIPVVPPGTPPVPFRMNRQPVENKNSGTP